MIVHGDKHESFVIAGVSPGSRKIKIARLANPYPAGAKVYVRRAASGIFATLMTSSPFHFVTDSRPDHALFEQATLKTEDLQVGDHVFVRNHPLYKIFRPEGFWGGEHSFISEIGSRDSALPAFRTELEVEGHGLSNTLLGMANEMLEYVNTDLSRVQAVTKLHLANLKANQRKTTAKVNFSEPTETHGNTQIILNVFEYDMPFTYTRFDEGKRESKQATGGFVIKELKGAPQEFQYLQFEWQRCQCRAELPRPGCFLSSDIYRQQLRDSTVHNFQLGHRVPQSANGGVRSASAIRKE